MKFEVGKFYKHSGGEVLHILAQVDNCTGYFNPTLVGESAGDVGFSAVGRDEASAANWKEVPPHEYYAIWLQGNKESESLQKLATPPGETEPYKPPPRPKHVDNNTVDRRSAAQPEEPNNG